MKPLKPFMVTIKTMFSRVHLPVNAESSADALIKLADRIPLYNAIVSVKPL